MKKARMKKAGMKKAGVKKAGIIIVIALLALVSYRVLTMGDTNARVSEDIRLNPTGERAQRTMIVTLADGRQYPVNFLRKKQRVFMGIDGFWWREFTGEGQPISLYLQGESLQGHARVILDDPDYTLRVFAELRPKWPAWLPAWINGKLVEITLAAEKD